MRTLNDAIAACDRLEQRNNPASRPPEMQVIEDFLEPLEKLATPTVIASDYDGFIIEGALQHGFQSIDDNTDLYVVSGNDLISFVKLQRGSV